jgi:hypothetical protein
VTPIRPVVPIAAGYAVASLLLAGVVAWQSGFHAAMVLFGANLLLLSPAIGLVWIGGVAVSSLPADPWWRRRAAGYFVGFTLVLLSAAGPLLYAGSPFWLLLGILAVVNVVALTASLVVEAVLRRRPTPEAT